MVTADLGTTAEYKTVLFEKLAEPPIGPEQLPPNVPPPDGEFVGGLQDRFEVCGLNPFALEEAGLVSLEVEVTTTSGAYLGFGDVHTHIPWKVNPGLRDVPVGRPVLLHGKTQATYNWAMTPAMGSTATLIDATAQNPEFTPDVPGLYTVTVTDLAAGSPVTIEIYAGTWHGTIIGQDMNGRPVVEASCFNCHDTFVDDEFEPWAESGHAEIFTNNLNTSGYYNPGCFSCHSVGYDPDVDNGGFDDAADYGAFLGSGLLGNPGDNWTAMLAMYPESARLANIQCENCHGPQNDNDAHGLLGPAGEPRVSLSSDVCATCHGEPLRHARFQQWQLSRHANYELAVAEGDSGSCSRCHTANGFMAWLPALMGEGDPSASVTVTWTPDEVHPQTCATCHDPHDVGTSSGSDPDSKVRFMGITPPLESGFTAYGVGSGAICMTCHNSRRGERNDSTFGDFYGTSEAARSPHGPTQTDLIMGENGYLVTVGVRGNHSFVADTCVTCHMERTDPPDLLAYNLGGFNHTFFASQDVCADCHGTGFEAAAVQDGVMQTMDLLQDLVEDELIAYIDEQIQLGYVIDLNGETQITNAAHIIDLVFGEYRGRHSMTVTKLDGTFGPYRMNDIDIVQPDDPNPPILIGAFYDFADPDLIKSGWNWLMVHNDGSYGVHNPTYSYLLLQESIEALSPAAAATMPRPAWIDQDVARSIAPRGKR
jgi:hypothetical protein